MPTPDEAIVVKVPTRLSVEQHGCITAGLRNLFPGAPVVVLDSSGLEIHRMPSMEALGRIEGKLDTLIKALAEDDGEDEDPAVDLDGRAAGGERDQGQSLG
jgi:hypothetical protein